MNLDDFLSGYLLVTATPAKLPSILTEGVRLELEGEYLGSKWIKYSFFSSDPLMREEQPSNSTKQYVYPIFVRQSDRRFLLMSKSKLVIEHILNKLLPTVPDCGVYHVSISIQDLVSLVTDRQSDYALTFVYAKTPIFGDSLTSVSFYGDNLTEARLFKDNMSVIRSYVCGLSNFPRGSEILRVSRNGHISFGIPHSMSLTEQCSRLNAVEKVLQFINRNKLIKDPI